MIMLTDVPLARFLGVSFAGLSIEGALEAVVQESQTEQFSFVVTPNVDHLVLLNEDETVPRVSQFRRAYGEACLRLCDSRILQLLAQIRGVELDVVTGSDLTALLFESGTLNGATVAFIGGDESMGKALQVRFPSVMIRQHIPPMGVLNDPRAVAEIEDFVRASRAQFVLLAFGAPQSEIVAARLKTAGDIGGVGLCIGASIEFLLGRKSRAPEWMQRARLEWAFRLLSEPRRLWRRYLVIGPRIFVLALSKKARELSD